MMGQGIGPLVETELRALAARILPQVDRIALREARAGGPLLRELGVSAERVLVTGDDAIELALPAGAPAEPALGPGLGVNLRVADYAAVSDAMIAAVRLGVQRAAGRLPRAPLVPLPISRVPGEEDAATIRRLTEGYDVVDAEGPALDGPRDVVARTRRCRVVVAGSYHAGVFALASGIPVVGLAGSDYYRDKLLGLADQFGCGCEVISLQEPHLAPRIETAVSSLWARAEELRPRLIAAAERQRAASRAAYDGLPALARRRRRGRAAYRQLRAVAARWLR
jgi:colanic acid/amylovoran biosynthesis protein